MLSIKHAAAFRHTIIESTLEHVYSSVYLRVEYLKIPYLTVPSHNLSIEETLGSVTYFVQKSQCSHFPRQLEEPSMRAYDECDGRPGRRR